MASSNVCVPRKESLNEPDKIAKNFIINNFTINNKPTIHFHNSEFWSYAGTHYVRKESEELRSQFHTHFVSEATAAALKIRSSALENAAFSAFKARVTVGGDREMPSWLRPQDVLSTVDRNHIAFQNGILNVSEALQRAGALQSHTSEWFSSTCLPCNFDSEANCENWLNFLEDVFEGDAERSALLQEWFGYCLMPDTSRHTFMLLEGPPRSGKGTCAHILRCLVGAANTSSVRLEMFGSRFQLASTVGKLINVIDETDSVRAFDEGVFKSYVAGERMLFDVKGKAAFEATPSARVLMICNDRPPIFDRSGGTFGRMVILPFRKSYLGIENVRLRSILESEISGIFNWALQGLLRLKKQDEFTKPAISKREREVYELESNPCKAWLQENYILGNEPVDVITRKSLFDLYLKFCKDEGHKYPLAMTAFNREVRRTFVGAHETQIRLFGDRVRVWQGIKKLED